MTNKISLEDLDKVSGGTRKDYNNYVEKVRSIYDKYCECTENIFLSTFEQGNAADNLISGMDYLLHEDAKSALIILKLAREKMYYFQSDFFGIGAAITECINELDTVINELKYA